MSDITRMSIRITDTHIYCMRAFSSKADEGVMPGKAASSKPAASLGRDTEHQLNPDGNYWLLVIDFSVPSRSDNGTLVKAGG